jgi:hypothetical protein
MRLAFQIFRKDAERLRWAVLLTLALLAYWTFRDATLGWGADPRLYMYNAGFDDWLNLALPLVWSVLIALAIQEDSLVGDRQFWVALPCGWRPMMAAKGVFVATFIHAPYFVAGAIILAARGFNPAAHLPHLFWKQVVLLALTIPALGAATLVRNVAHFLLLAIVLASAVVLRVRDFNLISLQGWVWDIRWELALIAVALGSVAVVIFQFVRLSTRISRTIGVLTAIAAACLYSWISLNATAAIAAAFSRAPGDGVNVRVGTETPRFSSGSWRYNVATVRIPLVLDGGGSFDRQADQVSLEIITGDGSRYSVTPARNASPASREAVAAALYNTPASGSIWEVLEFFHADVWARLGKGRVTLRGRMIVEYQQAVGQAIMQSGEVHCVRNKSFKFGRLTVPALVGCDSVEIGGRNIRFSRRPGASMQERQFSFSHFPADRWLSPVHRSNGFFTSDVSPTAYESRGFQVVDYELPNIDLNQFLVEAR